MWINWQVDYSMSWLGWPIYLNMFHITRNLDIWGQHYHRDQGIIFSVMDQIYDRTSNPTIRNSVVGNKSN